MRFFFSTQASPSGDYIEQLRYLRRLVAALYDRSSRETMMVQASFIWLAFDSEMLKVNRGLALAEFPEIEKYPHTELSRRVAASIRAALNGFFGSDSYSAPSDWPHYFWNRGLEIDTCYFSKDVDA
jgi:hypothetical protein